MENSESTIWERLKNTRSLDNRPSATWLGEVYSLQLSHDLRHVIGEQLGLCAEEGWVIISMLLAKYGPEPELIHAAGICHQPDAKKFLLSLLQESKDYNLIILKALTCWGASLSIRLLKNILSQPDAEKRLAGLELLKFKLKDLSDQDLISITKDLLNDFRDPIVIKTIEILQRRDGVDICDNIAKTALNGSDASSYKALIALGAIQSTHSIRSLEKLITQCTDERRRSLAIKQLQHQYKFLKPGTSNSSINNV